MSLRVHIQDAAHDLYAPSQALDVVAHMLGAVGKNEIINREHLASLLEVLSRNLEASVERLNAHTDALRD